MNQYVIIAIAVGVAFSILFTVATNYFVGLGGLMVDVWEKINNVRERRIRLRIDQELAKHGLTSDMVVEALNGMDEFRFFMHGTECIARKGPDGRHQFVVSGQERPEMTADQMPAP